MDEKLTERLAWHKRGGKTLLDSLSLPVSPDEVFARSELEEALRMPGYDVPYKVVPGGRELTGAVPEAPVLRAQYLTAALLPLADNYPMPFIRVED